MSKNHIVTVDEKKYRVDERTKTKISRILSSKEKEINNLHPQLLFPKFFSFWTSPPAFSLGQPLSSGLSRGVQGFSILGKGFFRASTNVFQVFLNVFQVFLGTCLALLAAAVLIFLSAQAFYEKATTRLDLLLNPSSGLWVDPAIEFDPAKVDKLNTYLFALIERFEPIIEPVLTKLLNLGS